MDKNPIFYINLQQVFIKTNNGQKFVALLWKFEANILLAVINQNQKMVAFLAYLAIIILSKPATPLNDADLGGLFV